jgi:NADH-quinone oxidoreductase subunit M
MPFLESSWLLTVVIFLPAAAALALFLVRPEKTGAVRRLALAASLATFGCSIFLWTGFRSAPPPETAPFQFASPSFEWVPAFGVGYRVGIDGISLLLVLLTTLLSPLAILGSWTSVKDRVREFHIALLVLETGMVGVFAAVDLALFYVFWELMLVPMVLLIGIWGSQRRVHAAVKFFVYTMVGSLLMFLAILYLYFHLSAHDAATFSVAGIYEGLKQHPLPLTAQALLFSAFALSFAIKVPLFPLHTWLPDAHTEAPTAGSVILAGVLLKMGGYGFIRFAIPFFPEAAQAAAPWISWLALISIVFGALMCLVQEDFKRLIAYSSVSHLGLVMLGLFAFTERGVVGSVFQMLSHGVSTGALFLLIGLVYERTHTRRIVDYGGFARLMPCYAAIFFVTLLSSIGLPSLNGFVGELLILLGTFEANRLYAVVAASAMVLGALYMLNLYQRLMLGRADPDRHHGSIADVNGRELAYLAPLLVLMVVMGLRSPWFTDLIEPSVEQWFQHLKVAGR